MTTRASPLPDRTVLRVDGEDAARFLQGLLTNDVETLAEDEARHAALLSPQGKILFEMFVVRAEGAYFIETARSLAAELKKKLDFYRLRSKVAIVDMTEEVEVAAVWGGTVASDEVLAYADPRLPLLGQRIILPKGATATLDAVARLETPDDYHAHRIALGVPEAGRDYALGDTFPHEADMDQLAGVDFRKGCYVGQEVVSRMQHRATARKRVVPVRYLDGFRPIDGDVVKAGDIEIGYAGSSVPPPEGGGVAIGLVMMRLDKYADALAAGTPVTCGGGRLEAGRPFWAAFEVAGVA